MSSAYSTLREGKCASLSCRALVVIGGLLLAVSVAAADRRQPEVSDAPLQQALEQLAARARPGILGVTVLDIDTGTVVRVNADRAYPMMSVFKAPVAATVLAQIDAGRLSLDQKVTIDSKDVEGGSAVPSIGARFSGEQMTFTIRQLLIAAVSESDNTAADALVRLVGGPKVVTEFLRAHAIDGMRVDLDEAGIASIFEATESGESISPQETDQQALARHRRGYSAYLHDPRNSTTPAAAADFLEKLWKAQLLSLDSTKRLLDLMYGQTVPARLRAGLPADVRLADKAGTSYSLDGETAAFNDIGIIRRPNGRTVIVAAFLTASYADKKHRDALFAEIAKDVSSKQAR
jgi:beta-lactamase class A